MNPNERKVLELLTEEPDLTPTGVARRLALHPHTSKAVCCSLHERGLLEMREDWNELHGRTARRYRPTGVPA